MKIQKNSKEYTKFTLSRNDLHTNPFTQFEHWYEDAVKSEIVIPNAMTLATVNQEDQPSARVVLLKSMDTNGFVFFTNYLSRKGQDLEFNSNACLLFFWETLERQIRIEGTIRKISKKESDDYFNQRPFESRLVSVASKQSQVISNRTFLDDQINDLKKQYTESSLPRPDYWGGYCLKPHSFEFWQGRESRFSDRFLFSLTTKQTWVIERLSP